MPSLARVDEETATWEFSILPAVPVYWRWTPTIWVALPHVPGLVDDRHCGLVVEVLDHALAHVITDGVGIPDSRAQQMLHTRAGRPPPAHSAIDQQFLRGRSDS